MGDSIRAEQEQAKEASPTESPAEKTRNTPCWRRAKRERFWNSLRKTQAVEYPQALRVLPNTHKL